MHKIAIALNFSLPSSDAFYESPTYNRTLGQRDLTRQTLDISWLSGTLSLESKVRHRSIFHHCESISKD